MSSKELNLLAVGFLGLCILGSGFYWFEVRPSNIRSACQTEAVEKAQAENLRDSPYDEPTTFKKDDYTFYYQMCTRGKGL